MIFLKLMSLKELWSPRLSCYEKHGLQLGVISDWGIGLGLILRHHDLIDYFDFAVVWRRSGALSPIQPSS